MMVIIYSQTGPKFFNNNCICCNSYKNSSSQGDDIQVWNNSNEKVNFQSLTILITCKGENSKETHRGEKCGNWLLRKHWIWLEYCPKFSKRYWRIFNYSQLPNSMESRFDSFYTAADKVAAGRVVMDTLLRGAYLFISFSLSFILWRVEKNAMPSFHHTV